MPLMDELKNEITRLARKEIKKELESVKKINVTQRGLIANLRRDVSELQKEINTLRKKSSTVAPKEKKPSRFWITGKGVAALRKRLGLTQNELANLVNVSTQSVVNWESTDGKISFRSEETANSLQQLRSMGKREVGNKFVSET
jgi:DNA-binding transcriptional regulator YiaG